MIRALAFIVALSGVTAIAYGVQQTVTALQFESMMTTVDESIHDTYFIVLGVQTYVSAGVAAFLGVCQIALAGWTFKTLHKQAAS